MLIDTRQRDGKREKEPISHLGREREVKPGRIWSSSGLLGSSADYGLSLRCWAICCQGLVISSDFSALLKSLLSNHTIRDSFYSFQEARCWTFPCGNALSNDALDLEMRSWIVIPFCTYRRNACILSGLATSWKDDECTVWCMWWENEWMWMKKGNPPCKWM